MVSAASQNVAPEPGNAAPAPEVGMQKGGLGTSPALTSGPPLWELWASHRALWSHQAAVCALFPKFVLRQALEGFLLWGFPLCRDRKQSRDR